MLKNHKESFDRTIYALSIFAAALVASAIITILGMVLYWSHRPHFEQRKEYWKPRMPLNSN